MSVQLTWEISQIELRLKYTWRISRSASDRKTNFLIRISGNGVSGCGEIAPNSRYGETPEIVEEQFRKLAAVLPKEPVSTTEIAEILLRANICNALRFGLQSAYLHYSAAATGIPVWKILGLPEVHSAPTCFSLPLMPVPGLRGFIAAHNLSRFKWLKVKVGKEEAAEAILEVAAATKKPLLVDGNEAWQNPDEVLALMRKLGDADIKLMEQPMPAACADEYRYLKKKSLFPLFADESVTDNADFEKLKTGFDGVNIKLMKAGGYFNALHQLQEAKKHGLQTMIGCMIETSLGISSAITLSSLADYTDLDGFLILESDPFNLVREENGVLHLKKDTY